MPAILITSDELSDYVSRFSSSSTAGELTAAVAEATDKIRQAALEDYTSASFESLTTANVPPVMRGHALAIAAGVLTRSHAQRPDSVQAAYDEAFQWLGLLAHGSTHFDELTGSVLVKINSDEDGARVSYTTRTRVFKRLSDASDDYSLRDPKI
jgi:phage gp36-like protein